MQGRAQLLLTLILEKKYWQFVIFEGDTNEDKQVEEIPFIYHYIFSILPTRRCFLDAKSWRKENLA